MNIRCIASFVALLVGAVSLFCFTNPAAAQTYTWDGQANGSLQDSSGTWNGGASNWWNGSDGPWADGDAAVFGAGSPGNGSYTVTLGGNVAPNGITFNNPGYTVMPDASSLYGMTVGAGGITTNASATINPTITLSAAQTWTTAANQTLTIGQTLTNPVNIGGNMLTLTARARRRSMPP